MRQSVSWGLAACVAALCALGATASPAQAADRDCGDFSSQKAAQDFFNSHNPGSDPHNLDADGDGVACESNPCPCSTAGSGGGGGGGGGEPRTRRDTGRLVRVVDGDTVVVRIGSRERDIRIIGIDTPEVFGGQECGGPEASRSLKRSLQPGERVRLTSDPTQDNRDRYGRLLRYVEDSAGKDAGRRQIRRGWAKVYVYNSNPFLKTKKYRRSQRAAKRRDRGVWGLCGGRF